MEDFEKKIMERLTDAMKNKDQQRLKTLRLIKSAIQYYKIEKIIKELSESDSVTILSKMVKQRKESIVEYEKAGRSDLAAIEQFELDVIQEFLPAPMSAADIEQFLHALIKELDASGKKDFGKVMKEASSRLKGRADGSQIRPLVESLLGKD